MYSVKRNLFFYIIKETGSRSVSPEVDITLSGLKGDPLRVFDNRALEL